ncbi:MAG: lipid II flippase MurJ, partial [bacterium]|nr:lipid II flippase MurJ [bacterium]
MSGNRQFWSGTAILAATTFLSYLLGFVRDRFFAQRFGASATLDAYNAAFIVPDLLLNIFVAGALTAAFIPVFAQLLAGGQRVEAERTANTVLTSALVGIAAIALVAAAIAPWLSRLVAPGFDAETRQLLTALMRLMLISPIIFAASNTLGNILLQQHKFLFYGLSPALYNLGIISGTLFLAPYWGIYGVVLGTIGGALLHLTLRIAGMRGSGIRYRPTLRLTAPVRAIARLMLPKMAGHPVEQFTFFGFTAIASALGEGSIAILNFARNFQSVPVSVIGIAAGLALFPQLTAAAATKNAREFRARLIDGLWMVLVLTALAAIVMYVLRTWLVGLLLGGGRFGNRDVALTASTLAVFTLSIPTESL